MTLVAAALLLASCVTTYQPRGGTGGWTDRPLADNRYYVEFFGNGNTTRDTVMAYWLHRCAEITVEKGFDHFVLLSKTPPPGASLDQPEVRIEFAGGDADPEDARPVLRAKGGVTYVPIYVPGGRITTWSARGVIEMSKGYIEREGRPTFDARELLAKLGPAVRQASQAGTNVTLPKEMAEEARAERASGQGEVKLQDLEGLLPKE
jgi:hypothetical protein